jgi:predicted phage terminase large subunit-like protein
MMPRGSYKTTISTQAYATWRLAQDPNLRILLDSEVLQNSLNNLGVIKRIFEGHPRFRSLYGDYTSKLWTQDHITVGKRTKLVLKEPSVTASSIETVQVGPHYDEIICDDLHSEKNSRTRDQVAQVVEHFRLLFNLLEPGGRMVVIGTRWSDFDLYGQIMESLDGFSIISRGAHNPDGSLFFPERLTEDFLKKQRGILGADIYNSQYENNPLPTGDNARFKKEWFKYFGDDPEGLAVYIAVDPALPGPNTSDYFAIVVGGLTRTNDLYILDTFYGHWEPHEAINRIFMAAEKYDRRGLKAIGIETNIFQRLIKFQFQAEMKKRNKFYKVEEVKHYSESKEDRILSLQPRYEMGAVFHRQSLKDGELEEELLKFPRGRKKDLIDAEASLLEIAKLRTATKKSSNIIAPQTFGEMIKLHVEEKRKAARFVTPLGDKF